MSRKRANNEEHLHGSGKRVDAPKSPPLSYQSLKCVLEYMEPNLRFEVSRRIPSIRRAEKIVPLKINHLSFNECSVKINETKYQLGIFRKFHEGEAPPHPEVFEKGNNLPFDIDEYGFREADYDELVTPGDVKIQHNVESLWGTRESIIREKNWLRFKTLKWGAGKSNPHHRLENKSYFLSLYNNEKPGPWDCFIQLTVKRDDEKVIGKTPYTFKLHEAFKILTTSFFDGRRPMIHVNLLTIEREEVTIRLPPALKFHVKHLNIEQYIARTLNELEPILDGSNLSSLRVVLAEDSNDDLMHPVFFVEEWLESRRDVGTIILFECSNEKTALEKFNKFKSEEYNFEVQNDRCLIINPDDCVPARVTIDANKEDSTWLLKVEVVSR